MSDGTLSGRLVEVETILFVNSHLAEDRLYAKIHGYRSQTEDIIVPEGHRTGGVPAPVYNEFSRGSERACADVVITTRFPDGEAAVLVSKRAANKPFGGCWWMQGGSYHTYRLISDFLIERAEKECGVCPSIEGFIGVFRTCAEDYLASTTNLCYVGFAPYEEIRDAQNDKDHEALRVLRLEDLLHLPAHNPASQFHWYPMFAFKRALETMPK